MNIDFINDDQSYTNKISSISSEIDEYDSSESIEYVNKFSDLNESSVNNNIDIQLSNEMTCTLRLLNLESIWIDMCVSIHAVHILDNIKIMFNMAYFSIKDRLINQYQDPDRSKELRYRANYNHHNNFKIGDVFDDKRYRELLSYRFFNDK
ncbi:1839_t:CDS:2 [Funneliformis caledonium]|uniref:1839_t:CDS:1 n=1 Tax=Funneliformis caledonium TaxID=1117310 RepID=A0A9N9NDG5_9GLOM|nr:1839_t:CDS:2 [Funneliformis caledonium]